MLQQDDLYRVMRNNRTLDWVSIIVPHYGYCVVPHASVDHFEPISAPSPNTSELAAYNGPITSLVLLESSHETLFPLIEYLGPTLLSLVVDGDDAQTHRKRITCAFLDRVLRVCPQLQCLNLKGPEARIETVLMEAYRSGSCEIESLHLSRCLSDPSGPAVAFINMLQDQTSAAAKTLRRLT